MGNGLSHRSRLSSCPAAHARAAHLHWASTVCHRAERLVVALAADVPIRGEVIRYVNRLSDALFVAARAANRLAGVPDVAWNPTGDKQVEEQTSNTPSHKEYSTMADEHRFSAEIASPRPQPKAGAAGIRA